MTSIKTAERLLYLTIGCGIGTIGLLFTREIRPAELFGIASFVLTVVTVSYGIIHNRSVKA